MRRRMDRATKRSLIALLAVAVLAVAGFIVADRLEASEYRDAQGVTVEGFGELPTIQYRGTTWRKKSAVHTMLVIGYDKNSDEELVGSRNGARSDFLVLLVINDTDQTIRQLWIDRNTVTSVHVLGMSGRDAGHKDMQIAYSHIYGRTVDENDRMTAEAVENLLPGLTVDEYVSMGMDFIPAFNNLVGGVTVTIEDDFTASDPEMKPGVTLQLSDEQAILFCRGRQSIGDGLNSSRIRRQKAYALAASEIISRRIREDSAYASNLVYGVEEITNTNMTRGRVINELKRAANYRIGPAESLEGEGHTGYDGLLQLEIDEEVLQRWVLSALYDRI